MLKLLNAEFYNWCAVVTLGYSSYLLLPLLHLCSVVVTQ